MSFMEISSIQMRSTTPPRPRVDLKRSPTSVPEKTQFETRTLRTPPDISLPTTNPPWPWKTMQLSTRMFSHGMPRSRPALSLPLLMQMPSSPTSKREPVSTTLRHDSMSIPSLFCA